MASTTLYEVDEESVAEESTEQQVRKPRVAFLFFDLCYGRGRSTDFVLGSSLDYSIGALSLTKKRTFKISTMAQQSHGLL